jgi:hypothetical protein
MICKVCSGEIESERLAILPNTAACSSCANKLKLGVPRKAFTVHSHKTGSEIQIVSSEFFNKNKNYFIPNGARSCVKNFAKSTCN